MWSYLTIIQNVVFVANSAIFVSYLFYSTIVGLHYFIFIRF